MFKEKVCKTCKQAKQISDFPKKGSYRLNSCDMCYKEYYNDRAREKYKTDLEYLNKKRSANTTHRLKYKYNTTPETIQALYEKQKGLCANTECNVPISFVKHDSFEKQAIIDHDHKTGKVRSLLCQRCNLILGYLEKRPRTIIGLQKYLEHFKTTH